MTFNLFPDPGHGGPDQGNVHNGIEEAPLVMRVCRRLQEHAALVDGWSVLLSRDDDEDPYHSERDRRAREFGTSFVLSVHADAEPGGTSWRGATVFHWGANRRTKIIADEIAEAMPSELRRGSSARVVGLGANGGNYPRAANVVGAFTPPTVLVELGYLTNQIDAEYLGSTYAIDRVVAALFAGAIRAAQIYGD